MLTNIKYFPISGCFNMSRLKSPVMMISCTFKSKARPKKFSIESSIAGGL